jgi:hypothetical protein
MNFSKDIEDYLEYFIDHYEFFKSKKTKSKREEVYSVYEKIYKELVKSEKELNLSKQYLTHDLTYITFPREQTPLSTLLESNFVDKFIVNRYVYILFFMMIKIWMTLTDMVQLYFIC